MSMYFFLFLSFSTFSLNLKFKKSTVLIVLMFGFVVHITYTYITSKSISTYVYVYFYTIPRPYLIQPHTGLSAPRITMAICMSSSLSIVPELSWSNVLKSARLALSFTFSFSTSSTHPACLARSATMATDCWRTGF